MTGGWTKLRRFSRFRFGLAKNTHASSMKQSSSSCKPCSRNDAASGLPLATEDLCRMRMRVAELGSQPAFCKAAKAMCRFTDLRAEGAWGKLKRSLLVAECPEKLRLEFVDEFIAARGRMPILDADAEVMPHLCIDSAISRRYTSDPSGEQLDPQHVSAWKRLFARLHQGAVAWKQGPLKDPLVEFFNEHWHLDIYIYIYPPKCGSPTQRCKTWLKAYAS